MKYKCLEKLGINDKKKTKSKILGFCNKMLTAILICVVCLIIMEYSPKFKTFMNDKVLGENISFGFIGEIYNKYFGEVLPTDKDKTVSVFTEKLTYTKKDKYFNGYKLEVATNYLVPVITEGVVVYIGEKDEYGSVIIVEQTDGVNTIYGNINTNNVKLYDHDEKGSCLGEVKDNILYVVLEKDGEYLDIETYLS